MSNLSRQVMRAAEERFGAPRDLSLSFAVDSHELDLVSGSLRKLRTHDVTFFIRQADGIVVIRKPMFPPGAYRAPSGGVGAGESAEEGIRREAWEETGLDVQVERYVLRIEATFRGLGSWEGWEQIPSAVRHDREQAALKWWTHVFSARPQGGTELHPQDQVEIEEAKWVTVEELQGPIRQTLLRTGRGLFAYRVALTDVALDSLGWVS